ncbi:hypothetical protein EDB81DRAFT_891261 [Dactylonectria macrodidyma]|uniref:Uncharacterized protein n=1 Tax=Dactylonectria macrodidyma TaxID=307937 RepID=A0A9P9DMK1_9HYPO|nr:hypothetical protein EDB81DRAFT_891261 [Dactylonectria macrodidyma]
MKISAFFLAATFASVMAAPSDVQEPALEARAACWNRSSCGRAWSGKCEDYCKPYKFSHMATTDCGWGEGSFSAILPLRDNIDRGEGSFGFARLLLVDDGG